MRRPKRQKAPIWGLVVGSVVCMAVGVLMILTPVSYVSPGGLGRYSTRSITTMISGAESKFIGLLILFLGSFLLVLARAVRRGK